MNRRDLLTLIAGSTAAYVLRPRWAWATASARADDFFIFIHAAGGWDVTLWSDPRNERKGLIEPASAGSIEATGLKHWKSTRGSEQTFELVTPPGSSLVLGPAIGDLYDLHDRITIINGIAMNTVSHADGTAYSTTGRHRTGGVLPESSIDVLITNELGTKQLMPDVSVQFPSAFVGESLDKHAIPLQVGSVDAITKSFERSNSYLDVKDRNAVSALLGDEAAQLAARSTHPKVYEQLAGQQKDLTALLDGSFVSTFGAKELRAAYPQFNYQARFGDRAVVAAFAVEAMKRNAVRTVSFGLGGLDTHFANYKLHGHLLQELFDLIATMVKLLDTTPHPTKPGTKLSEHTHILVVSEFCRTPQINPSGGRDHYPNNSALVISPRFKAGRVYGRTDPDQLLPAVSGKFSDGDRAIAPSDILATFLGAFGIDPRRYMRDGEVVKALLV